MRRAFRTGLGSALLVALSLAAARAEPPAPEPSKRSWDITADSISYDKQRDVYTARGNVHITQPGRSLVADWVAFSNTTRRGVATGNVVIEDPDQRLEADVLHFQLDDLRGVMLSGRMEGKNTPFLATGDEIRKLGENEYSFEHGAFTTCRCPDNSTEPWVLESERAELEVGGYGTTHNTVVDILGVPVFWLPWMKVPLLTDRATGVLFPTFNSSSRTGFDVGIPFFWAALPNVNVTFTPRYLTARGFKPELDVEYVFGDKSYGEFFASGILDDRKVNPNSNDTPFGDDRWALSMRHDQFLPDGFRAKIDGQLFSDNLYPFDFHEFSRFRNDRFLESVAILEKQFGPLGRYDFTGGARYADDIQNPDNIDRDPFLLQRVGEFALSGMPQPVTEKAPLDFSFDTQLVNFYPHQNAHSALPYGVMVGDHQFLDTGLDGLPDRNEPGYGDPTTPSPFDPDKDDLGPLNAHGTEGNGRFDEGEPLADRGQRLLVNPRIALPLRIADLAELRTEVGYHGTYYSTFAQSFDARHLFTAQIDLRTRLRDTLDLPLVGRATHLLEPRLVWTGVTDVSQGNDPLLVPRGAVLQERIRQLELTNVLRDPSDRIDGVDALTFALGNRLFVPSPPGEKGMLEPPRLFLDATASASWDFANEDLRNLYLDGEMFPSRSWRLRFDTGWDLQHTDLTEALFEFGYSDEIGNDLGLGYRKVVDIPPFFEGFRSSDARFDHADKEFNQIDQLELFSRYAFTTSWAASYRLRYSFERSLALTNQVGVEYTSRCKCWAVRLYLEDERQHGVQWAVRYRIVGLGTDSVRPFDTRRHGGEPMLESF